MRYYTQQLYESMQGPDEDVASGLWVEACAAYHAALTSIKSRLPESMRAFADITLHDGVVTAARQTQKDVVELQIDANNNPWGPCGVYNVKFRGVQEVDGLDEMVGDAWLYEEVHLHPEAKFEYCVLLEGCEFHVVADEVEFEPLAPGV